MEEEEAVSVDISQPGKAHPWLERVFDPRMSLTWQACQIKRNLNSVAGFGEPVSGHE